MSVSERAREKQITARASRLLSFALEVARSTSTFQELTTSTGIYGIEAARAELLARSAILASPQFGLAHLGEQFLVVANELTDPKTPQFIGWPLPYKNPTLEAADLGAAVLRTQFSRSLPHLRHWLGRAAASEHQYDNNWGFASAIAQLAAHRLGAPLDRALLRKRLNRLSCNLTRAGMYVDRRTSDHSGYVFDYYSFWSWCHHEQTLRLAGHSLPVESSPLQTIRLLDTLITQSTELLPIGRSLAYREAALSACLTLANHGSCGLLARSTYARFWHSRIDDWLEKDWWDIFRARGIEHCSAWRYGTSYSALWALRGLDAVLLSSVRRPHEPMRERIMVLPGVGSIARGKDGVSIALPGQRPGYAMVHPRHAYGPIVYSQIAEGDLQIQVDPSADVGPAKFEGLLQVREVTKNGRDDGIVAVLPGPGGIWVMRHRPVGDASLVLTGRAVTSLSAAGDTRHIRRRNSALLASAPTTIAIRVSFVSPRVTVIAGAAPRRPLLPTKRARDLQTISPASREASFDALYAEYEDPWREAAHRRVLGNFGLAELLLRRFRNDRWIDIGTGTGSLTAVLKDVGMDACGLDISNEAISRARTLWPDHAASFDTKWSAIAAGRRNVIMRDVDYANPPDFVISSIASLKEIGVEVPVLLLARTAVARNHPMPPLPGGARVIDIPADIARILELAKVQATLAEWQ